MNRILRPALALLLGATTLPACDYAKSSPGKNPQQVDDFTNPPGYTNADVNADSINYRQNVHPPIGKGSANDIKNGGVDAQRASAPAGGSAASPQSANGQLGGVQQASPTNAASTNPGSGGGNGGSGSMKN